MKVLIVLFATFLSVINCSVLTHPAFLRAPSLDSAVVRSVQVGGNFAYSTEENHAYIPLAARALYQFPLSYSVSPFYPASPITSPFYTGLLPSPLFGQAALLNSGSFFAQIPVEAQASIFGQYPVLGQIHQQQQQPAEAPIIENTQGTTQVSVGQPAGPSEQDDVPAQAIAVDDDTVSVEAAN